MAGLSGSYLLHENAALFAFVMLLCCYSTQQVAVPRDLPADSAANVGVPSEDHSALASGRSLSIKETSTSDRLGGMLNENPDSNTRHHEPASRNEIPSRTVNPDSGSNNPPTVNTMSLNDDETNVRQIAEQEEGAEDARRVEGSGRGGEGGGNTQPSTCAKCQKSRSEDLLEEYDPNALMQLRIETIKRQILDKLRMERPPRVNMSSINIPAPLSEGAFIEQRDDEQEEIKHLTIDEEYDTSEDYYGKTTRVIVPSKSDAPPCPHSDVTSTCLEFDIASIVRSRITLAELWLYWTADDTTTNNQSIVITHLSGHGLHVRRTMAIKNVPANQREGWITVDIKHTVRRWRAHSRHDHVVQVSCPTCESNSVLPLAIKPRYNPFIVIHVTDDVKSRRRRNIECDANSRDCCRQQFHLKFMDLGWDWVIAPLSFDANYCRGSCANFNSPALTHTSIIQTLRSNSPKTAAMENIPRPCCSPRTSGSLQMIYIDEDGQFFTAELPQMKILSCGCS